MMWWDVQPCMLSDDDTHTEHGELSLPVTIISYENNSFQSLWVALRLHSY